jgi:hypothetical protein
MVRALLDRSDPDRDIRDLARDRGRYPPSARYVGVDGPTDDRTGGRPVPSRGTPASAAAYAAVIDDGAAA